MEKKRKSSKRNSLLSSESNKLRLKITKLRKNKPENREKNQIQSILNKDTLSGRDRRFLKNYISKSDLSSVNRAELWFLSSDAKKEMKNHPNYYNSLLNSFPLDSPNIFENQIDLDLQRTFACNPESQNEEFIHNAKRILIAYSRRNVTIGYAQGFNFIIARLLKVFELEDEKEEKVFWVLCQLVESILPLNYYSEIAGIIVDLKIFELILKLYSPEYVKKLEENCVILEAVMTQWFVSLFTSELDGKVIDVIWDFLFIDGNITLFKASYAIFSILKPQIMHLNSPDEIYAIFDKINVEIKDPFEISCYLLIQSYDFNKKILKCLRSKIETSVIPPLNESNRRNYQKRFELKPVDQNLKCDLNWQICTWDDEKYKDVIEFLVLRTSSDIIIIEDYFQTNQRKTPNQVIFYRYDSILIERRNHICKSKHVHY